MSQARPNTRASEILAAAARLFAERGYHGVSVRDICAELKLNCSIISYYYNGKRGLYAAVLRQLFELWAGALSAAEGLRPPEALQALSQSLTELTRRQPHLSALLARERARPGEDFLRLAEEFYPRTQGKLEELIRGGQRQGLLAARPPAPVAAELYVALFCGAPASPAAAEYLAAAGDFFAAALKPGERSDRAQPSIGKQSARPRDSFGGR